MKIGGRAKYFFVAKNENDLIAKINWAKKNKIRWYVIGDGSNLIPSDNGFNGLIIKNEVETFKKSGNKIFVGTGYNLLKFIEKINKNGLCGMEKMAGIPGSVGGAIYGCAGAYGQEIKDFLVKIDIFDGKQVRQLSKNQLGFGYRMSIFKKEKKWIILGAQFEFKKANSKKLAKISQEIIKLREQKYWSGLLCPGSFFKNILIKNIEPEVLRKKFLLKIPKDKIMHGKVSSGYLLESVDAKGMKFGNIQVANHHANLIYNRGGGKSSEVTKLSKILNERVAKKFGISLEEEVQFI